MRCLHAAHGCHYAEGILLVVEHMGLGWAMHSPRIGFRQVSVSKAPVLTAAACAPGEGHVASGGMLASK